MQVCVCLPSKVTKTYLINKLQQRANISRVSQVLHTVSAQKLQ